MLDFKLEDTGVSVANVYFTGICNLECVYCFQPKLKSHMARENDNIREWILSGKMLEDIKRVYGTNIEALSLWGGEPSLNLPQLETKLEDFFKEFPKMESIHMSSNFSTSQIVEYVKSFMREIQRLNEKYSRNVLFSFQISIDGLPEINDHNRIGSSAQKIMDNTTEFLSFLTKEKIKNIFVHFKGTHGSEGVKYLSDPDNLNKHYHFFDDYRYEWYKEGFSYIPNSAEYLTFVTPGHWTQEDGINLAKITRTLYDPEFQNQNWKYKYPPVFDTQVSDKMKKTIEALLRNASRDYEGELAANTTCGVSRGQMGISYDGHLHWCHSSYFYNPQTRQEIEDRNLVTEFEKSYGFSFRNYSRFIEGFSVNDIEDSLMVSRGLNLGRYPNRYLTMRIQYFDMLVRELSLVGQISSCYENPHIRNLAVAYLLIGGNECLSNNLWESGSPWLRNTDSPKFLLNGTFELLLEEAERRNDI